MSVIFCTLVKEFNWGCCEGWTYSIWGKKQMHNVNMECNMQGGTTNAKTIL